MLGPLDVQVLTNRTMEVQKTQGAMLRQPQDEAEIAKTRLDQEIQKQAQQVRRKDQMVDGRIDDQEESGQNRGYRDGERKQSENNAHAQQEGIDISVGDSEVKKRLEFRGQVIDIEV